ncbi:Uncharacterised protein [Salmonella enterica subsp. diarizonae]|nr:Uncharacterised protein [Salmonella enterica subsp. diarizonae]
MSRRFFLIPVIVLSLAVSSAFASEKDELALVMRQLDQLQASEPCRHRRTGPTTAAVKTAAGRGTAAVLAGFQITAAFRVSAESVNPTRPRTCRPSACWRWVRRRAMR